MSKFTEGKWTADDFGNYVFAHEADMMICQMRGAGYLRKQGLSDEEIMDVQEANARLISAAPEMYELLFSLFNVAEYISPLELINTRGKWEELLAYIDGEEAEHE